MPIPEWIAQWHQRLHGQIVQNGGENSGTEGRRLLGEREGGRWLWRRGASVHQGSTRDGGIWQALRRKWKWPWELQPFEDRAAAFKRKRLEGFKQFAQAAKAENLNDLRDVIGAMILSECAYKDPASDLVRAVNQFNMDFGGDLVRLERVQVSLDSVPHRYLLAEADDILFASFAGTKQYRDVLADANILQETLFHAEEDGGDDGALGPVSTMSPPVIAMPSGISDPSNSVPNAGGDRMSSRKRRLDQRVRPAAHKGFLTRAKAIPALELYQLAQRKDQRLVLCGHSLGGAVAAIATLAILHAVSAGPYSKSKGSKEKTASVKCITFAQPPVGNAALREYVHRRGWQRYFRTYCIPDDVIPRLLSPAYFDHYSMQQDDVAAPSAPWVASAGRIEVQREGARISRQGLSALQQSFWRVSRLVPLTPQLAAGSAAASSAVDWLRGKRKKVDAMMEEKGAKNRTSKELTKSLTGIGDGEGTSKSITVIGVPMDVNAVALKGQDPMLSRPMEIKEVNGGVDLAQLDTQRNTGRGLPSPPRSLQRKGSQEDGRVVDGKNLPPRSGQRRPRQHTEKLGGNTSPAQSGQQNAGQETDKLESRPGMNWRENIQIPSMPGMPSYVPFGKLFLLGEGSTETLRASEYTRRASAVRSFVSQLRARFHSHTMKTYRTRFHNMYIHCVSEGASFPDVVIDHINHMKWIAQNAGKIKLGSIGDPIVVRSAISVIPLGWQGTPGEGGSSPMNVELQGYGLNTCTQVRASVNGRWCSTVVESCTCSEGSAVDRGKPSSAPGPLQTMRITIGAPLRRNVRGGGAAAETAPGSNSDEQVVQAAVDANRAPEDASTPEQTNGPIENHDTEAGLQSTPAGGRSPFDESFHGMARFEGLFEHWGDRQYGDVIVHCTNDFTTVNKAVTTRLRRVRFLGLEGAGKTSLFAALLGQEAGSSRGGLDGGILPDTEWAEGVAGGVGYVDAAGINLQDLEGERRQLREEISKEAGPLGQRVDLVVLVHNLAHKVPMLRQPTRIRKTEESSRPALSVLLDEVAAAGLPVVLAITNKFAASAERRNVLAAAVMDIYRVPLHSTVLLNSTQYVVYRAFGAEETFEKVAAAVGATAVPVTGAMSSAAASTGVPHPTTSGSKVPSPEKTALQEAKEATALLGTESGIVAAPMRFIKMPSMMVRNVSNMLPFRRRETVLPVEGVKELRALVHSILEREEDETLREMSMAILRRQNAVETAAAAAFESVHQNQGYLTPASALAMKTAIGTGFGVALAALLSFGGSSHR